MNDLNIKMIPVSALNPAAYNQRKDLKPGDSEYEKLKKSLMEFGLVEPLVVNKDMTVIGGHQRLKVLGDTGHKDIPCVVVDLDKEHEKALNIALNKISGEWDNEKLADLLQEINLSDLEFELTGFDMKEMGNIFDEIRDNEPQDAEPQIDRAEELNQKWQVKPGDLWLIGAHRLLCGDSTKAGDVARVMAGEKIEVALTDPPYGIGWTRGVNNARKSKSHAGIKNDQDTTTRDKVLSVFLSNVPAVVFGSFYAPFPAGLKQVLVWHKPADSGLVGSVTGFRRDAEPVFLCGPWPRVTVRESCVIHTQEGQSGITTKTGHPHTKPSSLVGVLLKACPRGNIFDPFIGSGTTMVSCQNLSRKCRGIEIDPLYIAVILQRMTDAFPGIEIKRDGQNC